MKTEKQLQFEFFSIVSELIIITPGNLSRFGETLATISAIIQDDKLKALLMVLRLHFPEYFTDYKPFKV